MCIITALVSIGTAIGSAVGAIGSAIGGAFSAVSGFLGSSLLASTASGGLAVGTGASAGAIAAGGSSLLTVGGALAGIGIGATAAIGLGTMYHSARQSAKAQQAQADAIAKLQEENAGGNLEVNPTATQLQGNSRINRTLSSLRVPMLPQKKNTEEEIVKNVYGVDTNSVTTPTQNMLGLNIAVA